MKATTEDFDLMAREHFKNYFFHWKESGMMLDATPTDVILWEILQESKKQTILLEKVVQLLAID